MLCPFGPLPSIFLLKHFVSLSMPYRPIFRGSVNWTMWDVAFEGASTSLLLSSVQFCTFFPLPDKTSQAK